MDISNQFIDLLFLHPHFKSSFQNFLTNFQTQKIENLQPQENPQIQAVVEDITQVLSHTFKNVIEQQCNHLYESNRQILEEIESLKMQLKPSQNLKTQSSTAERETNAKLQTSIFFESDSQYDMKQIRKHFESEIENKILVNSFELDQRQGQRTVLEQEIQEKINASIQGSINRIELTLEQKFQKYSAKIEQRIEQLRKTIASVVQAMNEKQLWSQEMMKNHKKPIQTIPSKAFTKKEVQQNSKQQQEMFQVVKNTVKEPNKQGLHVSIKNPQKQKQHPAVQNQNLSSKKAMQSLNKSINLGRSKIKSLFGFRANTIKEQNNQAA